MSRTSSLVASSVELTNRGTSLLIVVAVIAVLAMLVALLLARWVLAADAGTENMRRIADAIAEGANAFLSRQFRTLSIVVVIVFVALFFLPAETTAVRIGRGIFFLVGALFSGLVGYIGMQIAVRANVRVAASASEGEKKPFLLAFRSGGVVGMTTVGLALLGAASVVLIFKDKAPHVLEGFGLGAALLAMFMRVGGGIFTKAADVGADLVGKVEQGIPEDDPRNAATIADNVGDNVGDDAGMAADLFESYAVTLVAALILGKVAWGGTGLWFPLVIAAIGVITAVIGIFLVNPRSGDRSGMAPINRGFFLSAAISVVGVAIAVWTLLPDKMSKLQDYIIVSKNLAGQITHLSTYNPRILAIGAVAIGIVLAVVIQLITGYFTETGRRPVNDVAKTSLTGPATVVLSGISVGLESAVYSALIIGAGVYGAALLGHGSLTLSLFAIALAGCGLLTTVGVIVSMDTFGPISDNAQGIAEMSGDVHGDGAKVLTKLDAVGNTTKAITKGIAIATAVLAATALFGSFRDAVTTAASVAHFSYTGTITTAGQALQYFGVLDVSQPRNLVGIIIGAAVVFLFSGLAINAVGRAAGAVVFEVRRQFRENPGIMDYSVRPDYGRVVDMVTRDSQRELATPGTLAVMAPIAVGFALGPGALGSFLAGAIGAGTLMAVFLANSGGAWDNAKKFIEDGNYGGKGSPAHAATVIGDTVGDPFKDTAGPSLNPLLKVMNLVSLLVAPTVVKFAIGTSANATASVSIALVALALIIGSVWFSKRKSVALDTADETPAHA